MNEFFNMDAHHSTNYLEILMLCAKLWAYLLGWSRFSTILDKKGSQMLLATKQKVVWKKTKRNYKRSTISESDETIQDEMQAK